ncbi:MAG: glycoside hydrolase family 3 C-terminal domain-containing protein [Bacteroidales bacterium]|nr:glycoside hydrolase family 3 C-terminal domain-containing protein [Bacteroidales bacterium]
MLKAMTLREKVGQLRCAMAWDYYTIDAQGRIAPSERFKRDVADGSIGMLWATFRADPWTRKTIANGLSPRQAAEAANVLQRYTIEHSRMGIPLLLAEEAPHGHMAIGTTVFPTGLGMAATWSEELMERAGEVIAKEIRLQGAHISYGPVLDLATDPRWSRVEETFGEDPVLTAALGAAMVRGLGSRGASAQGGTLATLKHFVAYGSSEGGQNGGHTQMGPRQLAQRFLPPFREAIEAGAAGVMTAYNAVDAVPCTANASLLTDVLRREWGFSGLVVSDLYAIDGLAGTHHVASDRTGAAAKALQAGVDIDLGASAYARLEEAVEQGLVGQAQLDSAVARVLRQKIAMGLFEQPYVDPDSTRQVHSAAHRQVALDVARASVTLLKNEHGVLPLQPSSRVLVCGPNADNVYNQLGDYTAPQPEGAVTTVLAALRQKMPTQQVTYVKGCSVRDTASNHIAEAVAAAQQADVIVACVGGSSARDFRTSYASTGAAATTSAPSDMECGEGFDRASLELMGLQLPLLQALKATGKPLVVVYIEGRPLDKRWAAEHADALLTAYYPGEAGGTAVADVLLGDYNPAGRLPVSTPATVGQLPVYYNRIGVPHDYVESSAQPLYPFGYGLSYTTFAYSRLQAEPAPDGTYSVSIDVTNTGQRDGEEVVQLYLRHETASVAMPRKQLKAFRRIAVPRGQTRTVSFALRPDDFAIVNERLQRVVEPGLCTLFVGDQKVQIPLPSPTDE